MTKKDMEFLVDLIVDHQLPSAVEAEMIRYVRTKNPRFDQDKWAKYRDKKQAIRREALYLESMKPDPGSKAERRQRIAEWYGNKSGVPSSFLGDN